MTDCLFCRIVARDIPARIVHEDADVVAFHDIAPQAPAHVLVVPRRHVASLADAGAGDRPLLGTLLGAAAEIARREGLDAYRVVINNGEGAGQSVFHLHLHLLGGRRLGWPPG